MGNYSTRVDLGIPTISRDHIIQYYEFIDVWTDLLHLDNKEIEVSIHYAIGKITCVVDTLEEFKAESVGQKVDFTSMFLSVLSDKKPVYHINITSREGLMLENVRISCDSRQKLSELLDCIERAKEKYFCRESTPPIIEQHIHGDQISITGSQITGSNIGGHSNKITINDDKKAKSILGTIGETIIANVASNAVWWILGVIVVTVLAYLGVNNL